MFSAMKKISLANTNRKYKNVKIKPFKSDDFFRAGIEIETGHKIKLGINELFSKYLKNYNLDHPEVQFILGYRDKSNSANYDYL